MTERKVTERDLRMEEFRDAELSDLEFRADGKIVRKDRWERAVHSIRFLVGMDVREFEIPDVIEKVRSLAIDADGWSGYPPDEPCTGDIRLPDGSVLRGACFESDIWTWRGFTPDTVESWKECEDA
jgi:hypothetical protein